MNSTLQSVTDSRTAEKRGCDSRPAPCSAFRRIEALWKQSPLGDNWGMAVWWGMRKAEDCAKHGCHQWALRFFLWAFAKYNPDGPELWPGEDHKRTEVRILRAADFLWCHKCREPLYALLGHKVTWENSQSVFALPVMLLKLMYFPALTDDEYKLAFDAIERGIEPADALWPRRRKKSNHIKLLAAAQTIAKYETAKS